VYIFLKVYFRFSVDAEVVCHFGLPESFFQKILDAFVAGIVDIS